LPFAIDIGFINNSPLRAPACGSDRRRYLRSLRIVSHRVNRGQRAGHNGQVGPAGLAEPAVPPIAPSTT
jgi:hypothetical protein